MRLSALVRQNGIDPFTAEDVLYVSQHASKAPEGLILVGGQAIETWGIFFNVLAPTGDQAPLTEDIDWLGGKRDALWLCERLGKNATEVYFPSAHDNSPSSALAYLERPGGRILMMDFLRGIVGPTNEEVQRLAVPVQFDQTTLQVLHPLLCLESRMANLAVLPSKRQGNGPLQAIWAIDIARAYLEHRGQNATPGQIASDCRLMVELAEFKHGRYCWLNYKLDPLCAISSHVLAMAGEGFVTKEWPHILARVTFKRDQWDEQASRPVQQIRAVVK